MPLQIIFAGAGEFGLPTLVALLDSPHQVVQVISQPDRPAGRGRHLAPTPISQFAAERGLPLFRTGDLNVEPLPPADVMVVIAFGQKIAQTQVDHPRLGSINLHASLLPRHRGAAPIHWAILEGDAVAGNSVIRLADRMDAGPVLGQSELRIGEMETAGELHDRLANEGPGLVLRVLDQLARGNAIETPQDESRATTAPKLSRQATRLHWSRPAVNLGWRIRGLYPWPGCRVRLIDAMGEELDRLTLVRAKAAVMEEAGRRGGEIRADFSVATGDGGLEIIEIQPEGGRVMPLDAYRRGHRWEAGFRLESIG